MKSAILLGLGRWMIPIPGVVWRRVVRANAGKIRRSLQFMTADHHRVRDYAVDRLFRTGAPLAPAEITRSLNLPLPRVGEILDDLERHLTFLYRSAGPDVTWAYPVTVDRTPHRATGASGEQAYSP
jgi:hypothetical protein